MASEMHAAPRIFASTFNYFQLLPSTCIHLRRLDIVRTDCLWLEQIVYLLKRLAFVRIDWLSLEQIGYQ